MKRVIFKNIHIVNFLSVGEEPLSLNFSSGITLITGENRDKGGRNGVGKSTLVESLYWGLFGSTMRDIKRDKIIHNQSDGNCSVTIHFDILTSDKKDEYVLIRKADPNKVELICNHVDITRSSMPKTDELIKELIGAGEEIFQNAVIMTANNTMPFMAQKKVDKRKFVEGVLHLSVFGEMLLQIRSEFNDLKKINDIKATLFNDKHKTLDNFQIRLFKEEENKLLKIESLNTKIKINLEKISNISHLTAEDIQKQTEDHNVFVKKADNKLIELKTLNQNCSEKFNTLSKELQEVEFHIKELNKQLSVLHDSSETCPTCKRDYTEAEIEHSNCLKNTLLQQIKEYKITSKTIKDKIKKQQDNCEKISDAIEQLIVKQRKAMESLHHLAGLNSQISLLLHSNKEMEEEIIITKNNQSDYVSLIEETKKDIDVIENEIAEIQKKLTVLENAKFVVSEDGVKTFIIKKMLSVLNSRLNFYLQALEAPCKCEFNEMFEEIIYNDKGIECSYFNFSGGERKRIDLAILFMFQDLLRMQTGTSFSLSMYDELFDSALDEKGVDKILDILKERVKDYSESIYIISHNKASIKSGIDNVVLLEKQDGKTRISTENS